MNENGIVRVLSAPVEIDTGGTDSVSATLSQATNCKIVSCESLPDDTDVSLSGVDVATECDDLPSSEPSRAVLRLCPTPTPPRNLPDLVAEIESCAPDLVVRITNRGFADAGSSTTRLENDGFSPPYPLIMDMFTLPIPLGTSAKVNFGPLCKRGCAVIATANAKGEISESNKANNTAIVSCSPP